MQSDKTFTIPICIYYPIVPKESISTRFRRGGCARRRLTIINKSMHERFCERADKYDMLYIAFIAVMADLTVV